MADLLYAKLEADILEGKLPPGSRFPSQKNIALAENVSRTVVREAMSRLESQGFTHARQGSGIYVSDTAAYRAFQVTRDELVELPHFIRLLEMRLAIEAEAAAFAAARRTTEDIGAMRSALRTMARHSDDPEAAATADGEFHLAIARATRNDYFVRMIDFLGRRLVPPRNLYLRDKPIDVHHAYVAKVREEHDAILGAIVRMDVAKARGAAWAHIHESLNRHAELTVDDADA